MMEQSSIIRLIEQELEIDRALHDITTETVLDGMGRCIGVVIAKEKGVFCGVRIIQAFQTFMEGKLRFETFFSDGAVIEEGAKLVK